MGEWKVPPPPNPGSPEAVAIGCTCPRMDNGHGKGHHGVPGVWVRAQGGPHHGWYEFDEGTTHSEMGH